MKTLYHLGRYVLWLGQVFKKPENLKMYWRETVRQMNSIGIGSLVIIAIISIFIGAVTAVQFSYQMGDSLIPRYYIGYIVRDMTIIELAPKILAALTIIPMLVCIGAFISICGGYIASVPFGRFSHEEYEQGLRSFFIPYNITMMFVKALTFSFILTTVSCYQGYFVKGGSIELGHASTQAVVYSNILILLSDYVIAMLMTA